MAEQQLAELLVSIGLERNVEIDDIAGQLASLSLPTYIDQSTFKNSLLEAVESQLYRQTDERIRMLRQQFDSPGVAGRVQQEPSETADDPTPTPAPVTQPGIAYEDHSETVVETEDIPDDIPDDATMVWGTRKES